MRWKITAILILILFLTGLVVYGFNLWSGPVQEDAAISSNIQPNSSGETTPKIQVAIPIWVSVALVAMSLATFISVAITFYLYRWRRILLSKPNLIVPEVWGKHLDSVGRHVEKLTNSFNLGVNQLATKTSENSDKVANMVETFMTLQGVLDEREAEIRRFKKGYDAEVFRKFLHRFIRADQSIDDFIKTGETGPESLVQIKRLFEDAFDECGVEIFQPIVGDDYRTAIGIADNPRADRTERPEDAFKIAEVLEAGYRLRSGEGYEVIVPARVKIFLLEE